MILYETYFERNEGLKKVWLPIKKENVREELGSKELFSTFLNDRAYDDILNHVRVAQQTIFLSSFIIADSKLEDLLVEKALNGVRVYILTSTDAQLNKEDKIHLSDFDRITINHHKRMLDKFAGRILCRSNEHLHAKFLIIDPVLNGSYNPNNVTYISTANFASKPLRESPELIMKIIENHQIKYNTYQFFRQGFWNESNEELLTKGEWTSILKNEKNYFDKPDISLPVTMKDNNSLRDNILKVINGKFDEIILSAYTFENTHKVIKTLFAKDKNIFVRVITRAREVNQPFFKDLIENFPNLEIILNENIHAKFIITKSGETWNGLMFTSNFATLGLDSGYELGINLNEKQIEVLLKIYKFWKQSSNYKYYHDVDTTMLNDYVGSEVKVLDQTGFNVKIIKKENYEEKHINIKTIGDFLRVKNELPKYENMLFDGSDSIFIQYKYKLNLILMSKPKDLEKSKEILNINGMKNSLYHLKTNPMKKYIKISSFDELNKLINIKDQIDTYQFFKENEN